MTSELSRGAHLLTASGTDNRNRQRVEGEWIPMCMTENVPKGSDQARAGKGAFKVVSQHRGYNQCKNYTSGTEEFMGPREEPTTSNIFINHCRF